MKQPNSECQLILYGYSEQKLAVQSFTLIFDQYEDEIVACRLCCVVTWNDYQQVETQHLFNYSSELQSQTQAVSFSPDHNVQIILLLRPDLLSQLTDYTTAVTTATAYLRCLDQSNPLVSTESWLLLSANQKQQTGEVGYRAIWDYLDWDTLAQESSEAKLDDLLLTATTSFLEDTARRQLQIENLDGAHALQAGIQLVETVFALTPNLRSQPSATKDHLTEAITQIFRESLEAQLPNRWESVLEEIKRLDEREVDRLKLTSATVARSLIPDLLEQLISFFQEENWAFEICAEQSVLSLRFHGTKTEWNCYAQTRESEQQVVFYSVFEQKVPRKRRSAIAEFITRANYGLILGNFEMDFNDGEIRYKTSVGVEGSHLDFALIRQLVYSNLLVTDKYLPGIQQVIEGVSAAVAIAQIENQQSVRSLLT